MRTPTQSSKSLPVANSTTSFWRKEAKPIDNHRSTEILPSSAHIVIIGAGYTGAAIAHHLIVESERYRRPLPSTVILEAREAFSGATGRNGGHLKPDPFSRAASALKSHGRDVAEHVSSFEARQIHEIRDLIAREGIDCDFEDTRVTDVWTYDAGCEKTKADLSDLARANITTAKGISLSLGNGAEEDSGIRGAKCCIKYDAARLWPCRLVSHMLERANAHGVNLQTHTPVTSVRSGQPTSRLPWTVKTARGSIDCNNVIYATNGYTTGLIPELKDKIVPVKGMVARLVPTNGPKITDSYMLRFSEYEYDYMIPRPDGSIIVGGARRDFYKHLHRWFDVSDDSGLIDGAGSYFDGYMQRHFLGWENVEVKVEEVWTGIMGYSDDGFPYVGPICNRPGQYICAGFSGHGMPQIFLSAKAIAQMAVQTVSPEETELPVPYRAPWERWTSREEHTSLSLWRAVMGKQVPQAKL